MNTAAIARHYTAVVATGLRADIRQRRYEAQTAVDDMVRALRHLQEVGGCDAYVNECLTGLSDVADNIGHRLTSEMNDCGVSEPQDIDTTELSTLLAEVQS